MVEMADGQHQASVKANNGQVDTKQIPVEKTDRLISKIQVHRQVEKMMRESNQVVSLN